MKKILCAAVAVMLMLLFGAGYAAEKAKTPAKQEEPVIHEGALTWLGTTEEEFQEGLDDLDKGV